MLISNLPLIGQNIRLESFIEQNITPEYISWLNNKEVVRYSNQRFYQHTMETSHLYLASFEETNNLFLAIYYEGVFVGTMTAYISEIHQVADMGIMIGQQIWRKGVGLDAWQTLMNYLFSQGMRKVTAGTLSCNAAMLKIMERSGMQADGVRVAQELVEGNAIDILHFAKFKPLV